MPSWKLLKHNFIMFSTTLDFEMTLNLQEILERDAGSVLHPSMKSDTQIDDWMVVYDPDMVLPEPDDKKGILAWLGLNETVSEEVLKDYEERTASNDPDGRLLQAKTPESTLVQNLCELFIRDMVLKWDSNDQIDFEGYVNKAFRIGLRPEFALLCGMHPDNTYTSEDEKERWYIETTVGHVENLVTGYAAMLLRMWRDRAEYRSKGGKKETETENVGA